MKISFVHTVLIWVVFVTIAIVIFMNRYQDANEELTVDYMSGVYENKNWNDQIGTYSKDAVPDKETAIKVAVSIFEGMDKSIYAQEYILRSVFYDEEDMIWIVSFGDDPSNLSAGGGCSIALNKTDGRVLRIWFGE